MSSYDLDRGSTGIVADLTREKMYSVLSTGCKVRFRHYSIAEYIVTEIMEVSEYDFKVRITDRVLSTNIFPGDHVSIVFINENREECIIYGIVDKAQSSFPQFFLIKAARIEKHKDERKNRRYAVNICCNLIDENNESFGIMKNISYSGFRIFTKAMIEDRKNLKAHIFFDENKDMLLNVGVVRKKQLLNFNEYGMVVLGASADQRKELSEVIESVAAREKN